MSPVSATSDRSSMNGSVEYRALNVGFIPMNVADRMAAVGRLHISFLVLALTLTWQ